MKILSSLFHEQAGGILPHALGLKRNDAVLLQLTKYNYGSTGELSAHSDHDVYKAHNATSPLILKIGTSQNKLAGPGQIFDILFHSFLSDITG